MGHREVLPLVGPETSSLQGAVRQILAGQRSAGPPGQGDRGPDISGKSAQLGANIPHKGRPGPGGSFPGPGSHPCGHSAVTQQEAGLPRAQVSHRKGGSAGQEGRGACPTGRAGVGPGAARGISSTGPQACGNACRCPTENQLCPGRGGPQMARPPGRHREIPPFRCHVVNRDRAEGIYFPVEKNNTPKPRICPSFGSSGFWWPGEEGKVSPFTPGDGLFFFVEMSNSPAGLSCGISSLSSIDVHAKDELTLCPPCPHS